ncbi:MAG TPA: isoprenylcysteine carboxylmethyltransferase family protein [Terriglobales bacterium]|jgi:protein-S-isoprenylcysteine O-methyltransferase Ste14
MSKWSGIARRIRVPLGFAFAVVYLCLADPTIGSLAFGIGIALAGVGIRALASGHVEKNAQLTTTGPYAYVRNPLYLGSIVIAAGFGVAARSWWIAAGLAVMFAGIYVPVIRGEEAFLREKFVEYGEYARHVPRLFPRLSRFGERRGAFSWSLYWKHREYNAILGTAAMISALAAKIWWR